MLSVVGLDEVSLSLKREKLLLVTHYLKLLLEYLDLISHFVLGSPLDRLIFEVPLVPHVKRSVEGLELVSGLIKSPHSWELLEACLVLVGHLLQLAVKFARTSLIAVYLLVLLAQESVRDMIFSPSMARHSRGLDRRHHRRELTLLQI